MSTQHTPTPWRFYKQGDSTRLHITNRKPTEPGTRFGSIAHVDPSNEADAAHIVRCVNSHDALVEALRRIDCEAENMQHTTNVQCVTVSAVEQVRAALKAAEAA